jgi:hypothetical protein
MYKYLYHKDERDNARAFRASDIRCNKYNICHYSTETWSLSLREEHRLRVFENRVLRKIFGPKRDEVTGEWRRLHNEELHDVYSSPNVIRVIRSIRMKWAGHVACVGERRGAFRVLVGNLRKRIHLEDLGIDGKIIIKWILKKWGGEAWTRLIWLRIWRVGWLL